MSKGCVCDGETLCDNCLYLSDMIAITAEKREDEYRARIWGEDSLTRLRVMEAGGYDRP